MSVCNFAIGPARILLVTDTVLFSPDGQPVGLADGKARVSDDGRFVVSGRGPSRLLDRLEAMTLHLGFVDALSAVDGAEMPATGHALEWYLVGFRDDAPLVRYWRWDRDGRRTIRDLPVGVHLNPAIGSAPLPPTLTGRQLWKLSLAQWDLYKRDRPEGICMGGLGHLSVVTPTGASLDIVGAYPDYEDLAGRFGCPNVDAYEAWRQPAAAAA